LKRIKTPFTQQVPIIANGCFQKGACTIALAAWGTERAIHRRTRAAAISGARRQGNHPYTASEQTSPT